MWFKKLKKKKVQYLVIGLILLCISAIFSGCLCFAAGITESGRQFVSEESCPEFFFLLSGSEGRKDLEDFQESEQPFRTLYFQDGGLTEGAVYLERSRPGQEDRAEDRTREKLTLVPSAFFLQMSDASKLPFWFHGNGDPGELTEPEKGTVWVSQVLADSNDIRVGDRICVHPDSGSTLRVAQTYQIVTTPSATLTCYPFYVNGEDLIELTGKEGLAMGSFGCFTRTDSSQALSDFLTTLPDSFPSGALLKFDRAAIGMGYSYVAMLTAGVGLGAAFMIFVVSLIILRFLVKSSLAKEFKSIGIYKSLGYPDGKIIGIYFKSYLFTGIITITAGAMLGLPFSSYMGKINTKYVPEYRITLSSFLPSLFTIGLFLTILSVILYLSLSGIRKMDPVRALTFGTASSRSKWKKALISSAHSPLSMAVNDIFKRGMHSLMVILMLTVAFYLSLSFAAMADTVQHMDQQTSTWFGVPDTGCVITGAVDEELRKTVEQSGYTDSFVCGQLSPAFSLKATDRHADLTNCAAVALDRFDPDITGIRYLRGRGPEQNNEVAFSTAALNKLDAREGDYIRLKINEAERDYLVCGQYESMLNGGESMEILNGSLTDCGVDFTPAITFVKLHSPTDYPAFKEEMNRALPGATVEKRLAVMEDAIDSVKPMVVPCFFLLVVIFIAFSILNIVNLLLVNYLESRKKYGILKALGFTNGYICAQNLLHTLLLSVVSAAAALGLYALCTGPLFHTMLGVDGLVHNPPLSAGLTAAILIIILITAALFVLPLRRITPTELMEE